MVYVSFWTQTTFNIEPILTTAELGSPSSPATTYLGALWTTVRIWLTVLATTLLVGYPTALFVGLLRPQQDAADRAAGALRHPVLDFVPDPRAGLAADARQRRRDQHHPAEARHITSAPIEALLFTELSVIIGMTQIYCVFMVGPIAFMLGRIDPNVIEAARDLGAGFWRIFRTIILPLSMPGVVVGAIFVSVMVLGEFATSAALSGRKVNMLGNIIVTQVGSLKWAFAAVVGVVLTVLMGARRRRRCCASSISGRSSEMQATLHQAGPRGLHRALSSLFLYGPFLVLGDPLVPDGPGRRTAIPDHRMVDLLVSRICSA